MDIRDLRTYLPDRIRQAGKNPTSLALEVGRGAGAITDILSGKINKPRIDTLSDIARALGCGIEDLYADPYGIARKIAQEQEASPSPFDIRQGGATEIALRKDVGDHEIPVLGHARAGSSGIFIGNGEAMAFKARPPNLAGVRNAFALYVRGDSMEDRYYDGELIYIDPSKPVTRGKFVLIELRDQEAFVKRYIKGDDKIITVEQFNPRRFIEYPVTTVKHIYRIVGSAEDI